MKLTAEILHSAGTGGCGFNRQQLQLLGVGWPPKKGWLIRLVGQEVDDRTWQLVLKLKTTRRKQRARILGEGNQVRDLIEQVDAEDSYLREVI